MIDKKKIKKFERRFKICKNKYICTKKYVVGMYIPEETKYVYWSEELRKWSVSLSSATCYDVPTVVNKGLYYLGRSGKQTISKVFVKERIGMNIRGKIIHRNILDIVLTNPNHYEQLCAVVNAI